MTVMLINSFKGLTNNVKSHPKENYQMSLTGANKRTSIFIHNMMRHAGKQSASHSSSFPQETDLHGVVPGLVSGLSRTPAGRRAAAQTPPCSSAAEWPPG